MKYDIFSWNVNGLRAILKKGSLDELFSQYTPDILCIQEIKAKKDQVEIDFPQYTEVWNPAERAGYSGTAILSKIAPISSFSGFPETTNQNPKWNGDSHGNPLREGRVLTTEFPDFFLITVYTPNSKDDLSRLHLRETLWDPAFLQFLKSLEQQKPVVVCGDFNAAHTEIDLARPRQNEQNAGYTVEERQGITNLINAGFIDTFRFLHPDEQKYSWWSYRGGARINNIGWRIDYFFISESLRKNLVSAEIHDDIQGSDHCPISIRLEF